MGHVLGECKGSEHYSWHLSPLPVILDLEALSAGGLSEKVKEDCHAFLGRAFSGGQQVV